MLGSAGPTSFSMLRSARQNRDVLDAHIDRQTWRRVAGFATPYRGRLAALVVLIVVGSMLTVALPLVLQRIIDNGVTPGDRHAVIAWAVVAAVLGVGEQALTLLTRWFTATIGEGLIADLRSTVHDHIQRQPVAFFTHSRTGALVSRINHDVLGAQQAFTGALVQLLSNAFTTVGVLVAMFYLSWQVSVIAVLLIPIFIAPARLVGRRIQKLTRDRMKLNAQLSDRMTERFSVAGALLVTLYGNKRIESEEFSSQAQRVGRLGVLVAMSNRLFFTALGATAALATAVVYGVGGLMTVAGNLTMGSLLALAALLMRFYGPATALASVRLDVMTAMVSFERVFEVLDITPTVTESPDAKPLPQGPLDIHVDGVRFAYPATEALDHDSASTAETSGDVLRGIDLRLQPGTMTAVVGASGAGKTTLAGLLLRLHDPDTGAIRFGGMDARDATWASLRSRVSMVPQDAHFFHDTIAANLRYAAPDATDTDIRRALTEAHVVDLVDRLPDGLDTVVGDRGHRLSGGEKQRLALARLFLKAPEVVVLDEATAHLDSHSEAAVQHALMGVLAGRTSVVIAHRLSTVRAADTIVVLADGVVAEQGTHTELLTRDGAYAHLYRTQFDTD